jgi:hypothetical protein
MVIMIVVNSSSKNANMHNRHEHETTTICANGGPLGRGVNVWIVIDDCLYVATGSHKHVWRHDAYRAIGQDRPVPGTVSDRQELVTRLNNGSKSNMTCGMLASDPALR